MKLDTQEIVSMTAANQNFSAVARLVDRYGKAVIFKNNQPKYVVLDVHSGDYFELTDDEKIDLAAKRVMAKCKPALIELAK